MQMAFRQGNEPERWAEINAEIRENVVFIKAAFPNDRLTVRKGWDPERAALRRRALPADLLMPGLGSKGCCAHLMHVFAYK